MAPDCTPGCQSPCCCLLIGSPAPSAPTAASLSHAEIASCEPPVASQAFLPCSSPPACKARWVWPLEPPSTGDYPSPALLRASHTTPSLLLVDSGPLNMPFPPLPGVPFPLDFHQVSLLPYSLTFFQTSSETALLPTLAKTALLSPWSPHSALFFQPYLWLTNRRLLVDYPLIAYLPVPGIEVPERRGRRRRFA